MDQTDGCIAFYPPADDREGTVEIPVLTPYGISEAYSTYKRLKRTLSITFDISPSPKTEALIKSIRKK